MVPGDPRSGVLPRVSAAHPGKFGEGDNKVQAYCYRLCLTNEPANRVPFTRPDDYDPAKYELVARYLNSAAMLPEAARQSQRSLRACLRKAASSSSNFAR